MPDFESDSDAQAAVPVHWQTMTVTLARPRRAGLTSHSPYRAFSALKLNLSPMPVTVPLPVVVSFSTASAVQCSLIAVSAANLYLKSNPVGDTLALAVQKMLEHNLN